MTDANSKQRMAENEAVFRSMNQKALKYIEELDKIADGGEGIDYFRHDDTPLHFHCECSDENCYQRIEVQPSQFSKIHKKNNQFIVLPGHEVASVEKVVKKFNGYYIVQKHTEPPRGAKRLNKTDVNNVGK